MTGIVIGLEMIGMRIGTELEMKIVMAVVAR